MMFESRGAMTQAALIESLINAVVTGIFSAMFDNFYLSTTTRRKLAPGR